MSKPALEDDGCSAANLSAIFNSDVLTSARLGRVVIVEKLNDL